MSVCTLTLTQVAEVLWGIFFITVGCWTWDSVKVLPVQAVEIYLIEELWRKHHCLPWRKYWCVSSLVMLLLCAFPFPACWKQVWTCDWVSLCNRKTDDLTTVASLPETAICTGRIKRWATCYQSTSTLIFGYQSGLTFKYCTPLEVWAFSFPTYCLLFGEFH